MPETKLVVRGSNRPKNCFHTDPDCDRLTQAKEDPDRVIGEATKDEIEWHDMTECQFCTGEAGGDREKAQETMDNVQNMIESIRKKHGIDA